MTAIGNVEMQSRAPIDWGVQWPQIGKHGHELWIFVVLSHVWCLEDLNSKILEEPDSQHVSWIQRMGDGMVTVYHNWLVVWNTNFNCPYLGNLIISTDELILFRAVGSTTNQRCLSLSMMTYDDLRRFQWVYIYIDTPKNGLCIVAILNLNLANSPINKCPYITLNYMARWEKNNTR